MRTITVKHRETGEIGTSFDMTDASERQVEKRIAALENRIDHEHWHIVDSADQEG